ncbi:uncharacterized protein AMSG_04417 [Thecamonas trahens ATCC 50062]|uniref:Uncharacterized protein n=1 Tax=Thecamonas trahens ATCC 50062 TaxID=461836 RepID=A0A0L0DA68_THETB|nr:hypothetical protein AMSG_04417 [Thecamonas trahens ATCC 50062]KNC48188.1 hypothetical protein AMSG_04417 [Thecamonas trahens ATCC 50062]|eukprot:XP_013758757.1 hypothetical protein AMSG_04417 [Thecamonas trahens ATCC 50062]
MSESEGLPVARKKQMVVEREKLQKLHDKIPPEGETMDIEKAAGAGPATGSEAAGATPMGKLDGARKGESAIAADKKKRRASARKAVSRKNRSRAGRTSRKSKRGFVF